MKQEPTIDIPTRPANKFIDSGLGGSIPNASENSKPAHSEASSVASSMAEEAWEAFPQLTRDAKHGQPFHCDACGRVIMITRTGPWK